MPSSSGQRLAGKVALVTGGSSSGVGLGIGKAICLLFAQHGATVVVMGRRMSALLETVSLINEAGGRAVACVGDVTRADDCKAASAMIQSEWGALDVLVNNVGILGPNLNVLDMPEESWDAVLRVNLKSMMLVCKYAIPVMKNSGSIINVSSLGAIRPGRSSPAYSASKGAVISFTVALAVQHANAGIRANALLPGPIPTPMALEADPKGRDEVTSREERRLRTLLKIEGTPWDVAYGAVFLGSDEARWITGQSLLIDGGASIAPVS